MKKINTLLILILLSQLSSGQEFSFKMYFEDSLGNKDTLIIGFDVNGTDTIDTEFGEINIIAVPLDTILDVRISNEWQNRLYQNIPGSFHTKKQIIEKKECGYWYSLNSIDIFTDNWPVIAHWDSTLFIDTCLNGSLFTSVMPGGWWDTGGFREVLHSSSSFSFTPNYLYFNDYYGYINENNDTVDVFWQTFGDSTILMVGIGENISATFSIFPNPNNGTFQIQSRQQENLTFQKLTIFNLEGKSVFESENPELLQSEIKLPSLPNGMYFAQIAFRENNYSVKFLIQH